MSGGVSRSNVAVTDTFDTWRLRSNEINDSLNQGTAANTANTIMWRDDAGTANVNVLNANTANVTHTDGTTSALTVSSAVAAASDGTKAAILTTGGIYGTLDSKFAADLTIGTDLSVEGNSVLGNAVTDTITFTGRVATGSDLLPIANNSSDLGSSALQFANVHSQKHTMVGSGTEGGNTLGITASAASNVAVGVINNSLTTGGLLSISSSATDTSARNLALITQSGDVTTSGDTTGLKLAMTSGRGIFIDSNDADGDPAFEIDSETATTNTVSIDAATTTATGAHFNFGALTTGSGVEISSASSGMSTAGALLELNQSHALSSAANVATFSVITAGNGAYGVKVNSTHATSNASLRIDSSTTTKNIIEVVGNALSSGDGMQISSSAAHTGQLISLSTTNTADSARGEALKIQYNTANTTAKAVTVANSSADIFTVEQSGDVAVGRDLSIGGNLSVQGTTTQINTTTTLARDSSIVLGAQSNVVTGATYTAASPAVVTSTAHGLTNGQVIFVVASSGTSSGTVGVPSEQLFTVANKTTNTFEMETIDGNLELEAGTVTGDATGYLILDGTDGTAANAGDNILMSEGVDATGDSNRTFSWVGPQTDSAVDDAGLVVPGSSAKHYVKWDDTDNYWKLNDSVMVQSSGQFVFPKGTTADKPGSSATSTLAAATVGAMRFNTTLAKFEGVTTGTTYENMSTEAFSVAVSIALG
tara:strand:+ start:16193 stop:18319 length:2127 start_codon:yes stop_codon:yes gene_type:complete